MNRLFAFAWLVLIGTNGAQYYSQEAPFQTVVILAGGVYFVLAFEQELRRLLNFKAYLFVLSVLVLPIVLMLLADRPFERGAYFLGILTALVFVVASVMALRPDLDRIRAWTAFSIVAVGTTLNLYELLVENNVWSTAPGRSAGFYVNPNISGEALVGYGLVFLTARVAKLRLVDMILMALVVVGVFSTFSRAGILASLVLLTAAALMRVRREYMMRTFVGVVATSLFAFTFASYVVSNLDLSKDAATRVYSLLDTGGVGDYEKDRGGAALAAFDMIVVHPVFGAGVGSVAEMPEGPHNMFLAMMVDYGIFGLFVYLAIITRFILIARRANQDLSGPLWLYVGWLVIFSFVSHNLLEEPMTIPLLGFALSRAYQIQALTPRNYWRSSWRVQRKYKLQRAEAT